MVASKAEVAGRIRGASALAIGGTWMVLVGLVYWGAVALRTTVREQILSRDGHVLNAVARMSLDDEEEEPGRDPWETFLEMGRIEGIVAAWIFDREGQLMDSLPAAAVDRRLPNSARLALETGEAKSLFFPELPLRDVLMAPKELVSGDSPTRFPAVEVSVPLRRGEASSPPDAVAVFLIEAMALSERFRELDRQLWIQASGLTGVGMAMVWVTLGLVFRKLERARLLLARRTEDLQKANVELGRSARVAALGAVTAHLVHGLKNPVSGLRTFVSSRGEGARDSRPDEVDWREAKAATDRMQAMIHDVVQVIRERESDLRYEVPMNELGERVFGRVRASATRRSIRFAQEGATDGCLDNRVAGLLGLILGNLVENAVEATRDGGQVRLHWAERDDVIACEVIDEGPGLPAEALEKLFQPQFSTKAGGTGLGLAITRQLALSLGGDVCLVSSDLPGSTFRVEIPRRADCAAAGLAPDPVRTGVEQRDADALV